MRGITFKLAILLLAFASAFQAKDIQAANNYQRSIVEYQAPDVILTDQQGEPVKLSELIDQDKPVLLDFIYATCTTICPILSAGYSSLQRKLGNQSESIQLISISIDPEHDNPEVMAQYLSRYQGKHGWSFLTGSRKDIDVTMHAFDAYVSNKMSHYPLTLIKSPDSDKWIRLYGLVGTRELTSEIEKLYGPIISGGK